MSIKRQAIKWTEINGTQTEIYITSHDDNESFQDIRKELIKDAKFLGWHNPKWYEFWRLGDIKFNFDKQGELK